MPIYEFTTDLAALCPPGIEHRVLFAALAAKPAEIDTFLGVMTEAVPLSAYLALRNPLKVIGPRGMATIMWHKLRNRSRPAVKRSTSRPEYGPAPMTYPDLDSRLSR